MRKLLTGAMAAAGLALTFAASAAFGAEASRTERVTLTDLNMASDAGLAQAEQRLAAAIDRVCDVRWAPTVAEKRAAQACRASAWDAVKAQINEPALLARLVAQEQVRQARAEGRPVAALEN